MTNPGAADNRELPLVALLLPSFRVGGAERQALELATRLPRHGWRARLLVCEAEGPLRAEVEARGLPWIGLGREFWRSKASPAFWLNAARTLWRIRSDVRRHRPHVLQSFLFWENQLAVAGVGAVPHLIQGRRDIPVYKDARPWYQSMENLSNRFVSRVVCNSEGVRRDAERRERLAPGRLMVIPNGVDTERFAPAGGPSPLRRPGGQLASAGFVVGTVGNLKAQKRHELFLETIARLAGGSIGVHGVIVGDDRGSRRGELEALAAKLGVADRVHFAGRAEDVRAWLHAFDCFLLTSDHEGMPNVVLEAMSCGVPVVTRPVEGIAELVVDGTTGFVSRGAESEELATLVGRVMDAGPEGHRTMAAAARERMVSGFSLDVMAGRYAALYNQLCGARR
ncbi:glycosyltransferase [bacterium]|nr:glycosyltransferase [bacterium]